MKIDLLKQALLVMAQRYPSLALKLAWSLLATLTDYAEKKISQVSTEVAVEVAVAVAVISSSSGINNSSSWASSVHLPFFTHSQHITTPLSLSIVGAIRSQCVTVDATGDGCHWTYFFRRR